MLAPVRLLVVDDSATVRRVMKAALVAAGFDVIAAADATSALNEARAVDPDLMVIDAEMPGMDGLTLIERFADDPAIADCPIIIATPHLETIALDDAQGLGVVAKIEKPFTPAQLVDAVRAALEKHGLRERQETTPIFSLPDEGLGSDALWTQSFTSDEVQFMSAEGPLSNEELRAADVALRGLTEVLTDALYARGIDDADVLSQGICVDVKETLGPAVLRAFVRQRLGLDVLTRPVPSLYGDLAVVPLPEVLQLLKFQGQTGVLEVGLNQGRYEATLKDGRIVSVRARNVRGEKRLGHYFVQNDVLDEQTLTDALQTLPKGLALGEHLVMLGLIDRTALTAAVRQQAEDMLFEMLRAESGLFGLRRLPDDVSVPMAQAVGLSVDALLLESLRRIDEHKVIRRAVPSLESMFVLRDGANAEGLDEPERSALEPFLLHPRRTGHAIRRHLNITEEDAEQRLYRLTVLARITLLDVPSETP